jgi:protein SCO1/2
MKIYAMILSVLFAFPVFANWAEKEWTTNCKTCHTIGQGDKIGPDLAGVSKRRKLAWIKKFMAYPDGMINGDEEEEGYEKADPTAKALFVLYKKALMAEQDWAEDDAKVKEILAYIDSKGKTPKADSKIVCFEKQLKTSKDPAKAAAACKK